MNLGPLSTDELYRCVRRPRRRYGAAAKRWALRLAFGFVCAIAGAQWGTAVEARRERCFERDRFFDHQIEGLERDTRELRRRLRYVQPLGAEPW